MVLVPALMRVLSFIQGEIPDLFPDDELENIIGSVRPEVRGSGLMDTRENCWKFFIDRVRRQLKVKQSHKCQTKCCQWFFLGGKFTINLSHSTASSPPSLKVAIECRLTL